MAVSVYTEYTMLSSDEFAFAATVVIVILAIAAMYVVPNFARSWFRQEYAKHDAIKTAILRTLITKNHAVWVEDLARMTNSSREDFDLAIIVLIKEGCIKSRCKAIKLERFTTSSVVPSIIREIAITRLGRAMARLSP